MHGGGRRWRLHFAAAALRLAAPGLGARRRPPADLEEAPAAGGGTDAASTWSDGELELTEISATWGPWEELLGPSFKGDGLLPLDDLEVLPQAEDLPASEEGGAASGPGLPGPLPSTPWSAAKEAEAQDKDLLPFFADFPKDMPDFLMTGAPVTPDTSSDGTRSTDDGAALTLPPSDEEASRRIQSVLQNWQDELDSFCVLFDRLELAMQVSVSSSWKPGDLIPIRFPDDAIIQWRVPPDAPAGGRYTVFYNATQLKSPLNRMTADSQRLRYTWKVYQSLPRNPDPLNGGRLKRKLGEQDIQCVDTAFRMVQLELLLAQMQQLPTQGCPPMYLQVAEAQLSKRQWRQARMLRILGPYMHDLRSWPHLSIQQRSTCCRIAHFVAIQLMPPEEWNTLLLHIARYFNADQSIAFPSRVVDRETQFLFNLGWLGVAIGPQITGVAGDVAEMAAPALEAPWLLRRSLEHYGCAAWRALAMFATLLPKEAIAGSTHTLTSPDGGIVSFVVPERVPASRLIFVVYGVPRLTASTAPFIFYRYAYQLGLHSSQTGGTRPRPTHCKTCLNLVWEFLRSAGDAAAASAAPRGRPGKRPRLS